MLTVLHSQNASDSFSRYPSINFRAGFNPFTVPDPHTELSLFGTALCTNLALDSLLGSVQCLFLFFFFNERLCITFSSCWYQLLQISTRPSLLSIFFCLDQPVFCSVLREDMECMKLYNHTAAAAA